MSKAIPQSIIDLLESVFRENISSYSLELHEGNQVGQGYLGDIYFISLCNKKTQEKTHLIVKQTSTASGMSEELTSSVFQCEIVFYKKVWPRLKTFQESHPAVEVFDKIPICYGACSQPGAEKLVLENLKFKNFVLREKSKPFDKSHLEYVFTIYGKYHALSLAFKSSHPEDFSNVTQTLKNNWKLFVHAEAFNRGIKRAFGSIAANLDPVEDVKILQKFSKYVENVKQIFSDATDYKGDNAVILHGDSWSNNMMFKYDESGEPADIRLLDFQLVNTGTPAYDLSYFFYGGSKKEDLDKLDDYLKIYHIALSESLKQYGYDADELYSLETCKREWKQYCKFGFIMGLLCWLGKLLKYTENKDYGIGKDYDAIARDLVVHMYERDYL